MYVFALRIVVFIDLLLRVFLVRRMTTLNNKISSFFNALISHVKTNTSTTPPTTMIANFLLSAIECGNHLNVLWKGECLLYMSRYVNTEGKSQNRINI